MLLSPNRQIAVKFHEVSLPDDFPMKSAERYPGAVNFNNLHFHSLVEIGVCIKGSGLFFIYNQIHPFKKGDMAIVFADQPHVMVSAKDDPSQWRFVLVDTDRIFSDMRITEYKPLAEVMKYNPVLIGIVPSSTHNDLHCLFEDLYNELERKDSDYQFITNNLLSAFLLKAARIKTSIDTNKVSLPSGNEFSMIVPALNHITNNYHREINLNALSSLCMLSNTHFERVFLKVMGRSPINYLNEVRVRMASILLKSTDISVIDISFDVGYQNTTSFYRYFKKYKKVSPSEYRKRHLVQSIVL